MAGTCLSNTLRPGELSPSTTRCGTRVGIFDVSHMGDILIRGPEALAAVQHISMNDASRLAIGQAQYSALLYPQGTFVDDVVVHRLGENEYLLVINAGTREKDVSWVQRQYSPVQVRSRKSFRRLYPDCDPGPESRESAAKDDRRRPFRGEVLLGNARNAYADPRRAASVEKYFDRPHRIYRRRRIRNLRAFRRRHQRSGVE